jgi:hypothetical protein
MAVDSRAKRFSIMTLGRTMMPVHLTPTGTIGQAERQQLLWNYYGILWSDIQPVEFLIFQSQITTLLGFSSEITTSTIFQSQVNVNNIFDSEVD